MNDKIFALRLFSRVARSGSFSAAGRELGLSQPSASRIMAALEEEVGAVLLVRTTRATTLTDAGLDYLARIEPILASLEEADLAARGTGELRGTLRIGAAASFATRELIPRLPGFLKQHPQLRVDFVLTDQFQNMITEAIDVALRFGTLADSSAVARLIATPRRLLAAAPAYLRKAGRPRHPDDLARHQIIIGPSGIGQQSWTFRKNDKTVSVRLEGRITVSVNEAATAAALAGLGIISSGTWGCRAELESGRLVEVLPSWEIGTREVHAVYPPGRPAKPSARAFIEYLIADFKATGMM